jgi:phage/plasmid-associated DNA primase
MRENARQIRPTWKLFLTTNEQPIFPADAALRGRVHLVPFRADFSEALETTIDATLRAELPGILAELIALCPSVIQGGLGKPTVVQDSTDELFAELDIAARFQADCLVPARDEAVAVADVSTAAILWAQREGLDTDARHIMSELRKRFGKRYAFRKVEGKSVRVFAGVLLRDSLPVNHTGVMASAA